MSPWLLIPIALSYVVVGYGGYEYATNKYKADTEAAIAKQEASVVTTERKQTVISNNAEQSYESKINAINSSYDALLKQLYTIPSGPVPKLSATPSSANAVSCDNQLSVTRIRYAKAADIQTQQLIGLQAWIKAQASLKHPSN